MNIYLISGINHENTKRLHNPFVIVHFINRCNLFVMKIFENKSTFRFKVKRDVFKTDKKIVKSCLALGSINIKVENNATLSDCLDNRKILTSLK